MNGYAGIIAFYRDDADIGILAGLT